MNGWRKALALAMAVVFLTGLSVLLYPIFQGAATDRRMVETAQAFLQKTESQSLPEGTIPAEPEPLPYSELLTAMEGYNKQLWEEKQSGLCDPWSYQQPSFTLGDYGLEDEVFGVISIPKLDIEMPIYLGASYGHMELGAAHLSQTSLPIGGENTNCVIAGHRGWGGGSYFRYITDLAPGDEVIVTNLWETLRYTVAETKIIRPNEVDEILIQEGKDLLTLLTCHPYASGGTYRYVVYCERTNETEVS